MPVVCTDIPALRELTANGKRGLLFPAGDCEALASQLERALTDEPTRSALIEAGRQAADNYSVERVAAVTERVLLGQL